MKDPWLSRLPWQEGAQPCRDSCVTRLPYSRVPESLPNHGMIGLDMFICCLLIVHFLSLKLEPVGGFEGLTVKQLPQPLNIQHKY